MIFVSSVTAACLSRSSKNGAIVATADIDIDGEGEYYLSVEIENGDFSGEHNFTLGLTAEHEKLRRAFVATVRWTVENAYSYEFATMNDDDELVMIDLRLIGNNVRDGLIPRLPVPIYNVWQLQAASGASELPPDALALEFSARARAPPNGSHCWARTPKIGSGGIIA